LGFESGLAAEPPADDGKETDVKESAEESQEPSEEEAEAKEEVPETLTAETEPFTLEVEVSGSFVPKRATPVVVKGKSWSNFKIQEIVEHGAAVKKGDVLIAFEREEYERALENQRRDLLVQKMDLQSAELSFEEKKAGHPLQVAAAEEAKKRADFDFERYFKIYSNLNREAAKLSLESSQHSLEYAQEELRQLKQMYEADELTDESEELILIRQTRSVERLERSLERAKLRYEEAMEWELPQADAERKRSGRLADLAYKTQMQTMPYGLEKARIALEKQRTGVEESQEKLKEMESDASLLTIKAKMDGVVYYGAFDGGKYKGFPAEKTPKAGKTWASSDAPLMTITQMRPLLIEGTFSEAELAKMKTGLRAKVVPTALPDVTLDSNVLEVSRIPAPDGTFSLTMQVEECAEAELLAPGFTCKAKVVVYTNDDAIIVPAAAVKKEKNDAGDELAFIFLPR
jgi:multidrug resistance efflux pump